MNHITEFCKTLNTSVLAKLDPAHAALLQMYAIITMKTPDVRHDIAQVVLQHYNRDMEGRKLGIPEACRDKAEARLQSMSIAMTGARPGDVLIGTSGATMGAMIRIHGTSVSPEESRLDSIRYYPDLWKQLLIKMGSIHLFADLSIEARNTWLTLNEARNEHSIGQEGARIELVQPGNSQFSTRISSANLDLLMSGNPNSEDGFWSHTEIEDMVPGKPGSNAQRHTLILIRSFWRISTDYSVVDVYNGLVLCPSGVRYKSKAEEGHEIFVLAGVSADVEKRMGRGKTFKWERSSTREIGVMVRKSVIGFNEFEKEVNEYKQMFSGFTCASYKSLLQKIIRFRPNSVRFPDGMMMPAEEVLRVAIILLATHPGAFVPDIQRYVTGLESAAKRIGVTILEDSHVENPGEKLFSLFSGALLAQRVRTWKPDGELLEEWIETAIEAWESTTAGTVDYRGQIKEKPYVIREGTCEQVKLECVSAMLDEVRSFSSDLGLARAWARDNPNMAKDIARETPDVMPLEHCVDQHWAPGVAHYFDSEYIGREGSKATMPFTKVFGVIWDVSSSVNPRRPCNQERIKQFEDHPDVAHVRRAQKLFLVALQQDHASRPESGKWFEMEYTLPDSWIAGMTGAAQVVGGGFPPMLVTMATDDPTRLVVIRRPARNMKTGDLSEQAISAGNAALRASLKAGSVKMDKANPPHPDLAKCRVRIRKGRYEVRKGSGEWRAWDDVRRLQIRLPIHPVGATDMATLLTSVGTGVEEGAEDSLCALVDGTDQVVVRRALVYLNTCDKEFEMNRISRDGGSTKQSVTIEDVAAYQFMLELSGLYPAAIAPKEHRPSTFVVPLPPLLWTIRDMISTRIFNQSEHDSGWDGITFEDTTRTPWEHQTEIVEEMVCNHEAGRKGNFIWATCGLGKTSSVLSFLGHLKETGRLPKYVLYTLPESAIVSIINEIKFFGVPVNLIVPLANIKKRKDAYEKEGIKITQNAEPVPYAINLIEHDHLRRGEETFSRVAPESMFIVDEVHKTLNDTKRSSVALEIANLSKDFIALTGTPIIDSNTYKLIAWLKLVVPYEVNEQNFWVAANSMIAKKVTTGVEVVDDEVACNLTEEQAERYYSLVPGALGGHNPNPVWREWSEASDICYSAVSMEMVKSVVEYLREGRGVMVVAKDRAHQQYLYERVLKTKTVNEKDIFLLEGGSSIFLTDEAVARGNVPDYKVVIVPMRKAEGYTLTSLSVMVTSVYPSNNAVRTQLRGRINRIGQKEKVIYYKTLHCGILTSIMKNHTAAKNLQQALEGLAKEVTS